jgi:hypothetical protein
MNEQNKYRNVAENYKLFTNSVFRKLNELNLY